MISPVSPAGPAPQASSLTPRPEPRGDAGSGIKAASGDGPAPAATASAAPPVQPASTTHTPLSLDVRKSEDGVFVYTLSDPNTGTVLAVIPNKTQAEQPGSALDTRA